MYIFYTKKLWGMPCVLSKLLLIMRLTTLVLITTMLQVSAASFGQKISLSEKNAALVKVFDQIRKQSNVDFVVTTGMLSNAKPVTLSVKNMDLPQVLEKIFEGQPLEYTIENKFVVVSHKKLSFLDKALNSVSNLFKDGDVHGRIIGENGIPLTGATISLKGSGRSVRADANGEFFISDAGERPILVITYLGYKEQEVAVGKNRDNILVSMDLDVSKLDEISVEGYRKGSQRLATSNISRVTGEELVKQPVDNPLLALQGRIAGMIVSQGTGVPGARVNVQLRGRANFDKNNSSDQPLFVIDGVPMAANNDKVNGALGPFGVTTGDGLSAFAGLNTADIESIDVLKDADATAIYGSRGANGVILISTRKGKAGKMTMNANVYTGISKASRLPKMMNTEQYLEMRNEAFINDKITKTATNAYDLLLWDQTRYTDFADLLVGNTANTTDAQVSFSGGSKQTIYRLSGGYHKEGTVWPGDLFSDRISANFNSRSVSQDERFSLEFSGLYSISNSNLVAGDLAAAILLPPNYKLYNDNGSLSWSEGGYSTANVKDNPLAALNQQYFSKMTNLNANANLNYKLTPDLSIRSSLGYNATQTNDRRITPLSAQNPFKPNLAGISTFGNINYQNWIVEPQLEYNKKIIKGKLNVLLGATYNKRENTTLITTGNGYTSDDLLGSLSGAITVAAANTLKQYSYQAFFGRVNYNWEDKYILNLTGRRDGSSRFGPEARFSNFGAAGAAWLFSNEEFLKGQNILSYGKLRASFGVTGNDQIADYAYLDTWTAGSTYADSATLAPSKLYSPLLRWERNNKLEIGLELGFLKDRFLVTASAYQNISSDPLVSYLLPGTTGFTSIVNNLNGVEVENKGLEMTLSSKNIKGNSPSAFSWSTDFNITIPKNRLKAFPDLANSSYVTSYTIGQPLNQAFTASFLGVDPATGLYSVKDLNGDGLLSGADFTGTINTDPKYYGGLTNNFNYKRFSMSFFIQFTKQMGKSWKTNNLYNPPGMVFNVPAEALSRWQAADQITDVQRYTTSAGSIIGTSGMYAFMFSDGQYTDASFLRLKNVNFSYELPVKWLSAAHIRSCRIYLQGQNLFLITGYKVGDPETQNYTRMAPLRTITGGLQLSL